MSEIIKMNQKLKQFVQVMGINQKLGENVVLEMIVTFAYTEGFTDGYAKGYAEAICEAPCNEGGNER